MGFGIADGESRGRGNFVMFISEHVVQQEDFATALGKLPDRKFERKRSTTPDEWAPSSTTEPSLASMSHSR